jgi:Flp pilus assembly protein TadD
MNLLTRLKQKIHSVRHEGEVRAAYADGRLDEALRHAHTLYEFDLDNPWANFLLACHHLEADRYGDALPHLNRVVREWQDDAWAWYAIGVCQDREERPDEAVQAYRRALSLVPDWSKALKNIGRDLYLLGDYPAAEEALRRYCAATFDDKEAHDLLGYICYRQGKFMLSFRHYESARRLDPLNPKLERNARLLYGRSATS